MMDEYEEWGPVKYKQNQKNSKDVQEFLDRGGEITRIPDYITRGYYNTLRMLGTLGKEIRKTGEEQQRKIVGINEEPYEEAN